MRRKGNWKAGILAAGLCAAMIAGTGFSALADTGNADGQAGQITLEASVTQGDDLGVELSWNDITTDTVKYGYHILRSSDGGKTWETRSSWNVGDKVKVLNIHPGGSAANHLKNWMERVADQTTGETAGKGLFEIDTVYIEDYNQDADSYLKDENGEYKYDVLFFGTADSNGGKDLTEESFVCTQKFIDSGRGVLFGHDTVCRVEVSSDNHPVFAQFDEQLGIIAAKNPESPDSTSKVQVVKQGLLTAFPWEINGELTVPTTHVWGQYSGGDLPATVWMTLDNRNPTPHSMYEEYARRGLLRNAYLVSNNQLAMIQTGHSNGQASDDECKVIANTLFYLKQLTDTTRTNDYSFYDVTAPEKAQAEVELGEQDSEKFEVYLTVNSKDLGTNYIYKTEAIPYVQDAQKVESNEVEAEAFVGMKGFVLIATETEDSVADELEYEEDGKTLKNLIESESGMMSSMTEVEIGENKYLHIFAVDKAGNISEETVVNVSSNVMLKGKWMQEGPGWWYLNADGSYPKDTWQQIDGKWYHFDPRGYRQTGWIKVGAFWYHLNPDGTMSVNAWIDNQFYVGEDGKWDPNKQKAANGWKQDSKGWWYQNEDGTYPKNQWKKIDGKWYHFDAKGYRQTGWYKEGEAYYYFKEDGVMAANEWVENDKYYLGADGKWVKDKQKDETSQTGTWKKDKNGWWYQNADGTYPKSQWKKIDGKWYHFDAKGYMQTGWYKEGEYWYYFKADGSMACNEQVEDGQYTIDANGHWVVEE